MADFEKKVTLIEVEVDNKAAMAQVESLTEAILSQKKQVQDNNDAIKAYNKANQDAAKALKEGKITLEDYNKITSQNTKAVQDLQKQNLALGDGLKDLNAERANAVKVSKLQANSLDALRKQTAEYKKELNGINTSTVEGAARFEELTTKLKDNNDKIKQLDQAAGDFKTSIGDYTGGIIAATQKTGLFGDIQGKLVTIQEGYKKSLDLLKGAQDSASTSTKGFGGSMGALNTILKANVIGLVVASLGALISYLTTTQEGIDKVTSVTRPLFAVFEKMKGVVQELGKNVFGGLAKILSGDIREGLLDIGGAFRESFSDVKNAITEGIEAGTQLDKLTKQIERAEIALAVTRASLNAEYEKSKEIAEDVTRTEEERIKAAEAAIASQNKLLSEEQALIDMKIEKMKLEQSLNDTSREQELELANLEAERIRFEGEAAGKRTSINNFLNSLKAQIAAEDLARIKSVSDAEKKAADEKLAAEKKAAEEAAKIQAEADKERIKNLEILNTKMLALEEFRRSQSNETRINEAKDVATQLKIREQIEAENFAIMQERIKAERDQVFQDDKATKEAKLIAEQDFLLQMEELAAQHSSNIKEIEEARKAESERIEKEKQDKLKSYAAAGNQAIASGFQITNNLIKGYYSDRYANIQKQLESGQITEEQYARKKANLDRNQAKDLYKAQLAEFKIKKGVALGRAIADTAQSIMAAVAASPLTGGLPFSAINGGIGGIQIATIATEKAPPPPSFKFGGDVEAVIAGGKPHSLGGTKYMGEDGNIIEVERGEGLFVTKREATNPALRLLSEQNVLAGGRSMFAQTSRYLENGGGANLNPQQDLTILAEAIQNMPPPVIGLESIMAGIGEVERSRKVGIV